MDDLQTLLQRLDETTATHATLEAYYAGTQPLAYLSPEAKKALGDRFGVMASNIPRLAVTALAERLRVTGFTDVDVWADWIRNDLDQLAGVAHREALLLGSAYVIVWADDAGRPRVSIESPRQVTVLRDPGTRKITAAVKRWETRTSTEAVLYGPDTITRLSSPQLGATLTGFQTVATIDNPLGVPPVVQLRNGDRLLGDGTSEIADLLPLVDGLNKLLADMLVSSEYFARPRRWATGIEPDEQDVLDELGQPTGETVAVNPFPEGDRMMLNEASDGKFGQLPAGDMNAYESGVRVLLSQIMAVSALPAHYLGVLTSQPSSADALRAAEASLSARAEARQATFGRAWEDVARLIVAVRDGTNPEDVTPRVSWADAATRSVAQEADAIVKLHTAGLLPTDYALKRLGYDDDQLTEIRKARQSDTTTAEVTP